MGSPWKQQANSKGGEDFELPPAGAHAAVLVALIDLGTQKVEYGGEVDWKQKVVLVWELPGVTMTGTTANHVVSRDYTLSFHKKSMLRGLIEKWRARLFNDGEDYDLSVLLGKPCLLTLTEGKTNSDRKYVKVDAVTQLPKTMTAGKAQHTPFAWSPSDGTDYPDPAWVPFLYGRRVAEVIRESREAKGLPPREPGDEPAEEAIPEGNEIPF